MLCRRHCGQTASSTLAVGDVSSARFSRSRHQEVRLSSRLTATRMTAILWNLLPGKKSRMARIEGSICCVIGQIPGATGPGSGCSGSSSVEFNPRSFFVVFRPLWACPRGPRRSRSLEQLSIDVDSRIRETRAERRGFDNLPSAYRGSFTCWQSWPRSSPYGDTWKN